MKNIFINGYLGFKNFGDDLLFYTISKFINSKNKRIYYISKIPYRNLKNNFQFLDRKKIYKLINLANKDSILINLGGIFQDLTSSLSFLYYFFVNLIFILKKSKIINISIDSADLKRKLNIFLFKLILKNSYLTIFRDKISFSNFKSYRNIFFAPDITFFTKFKNIKTKKNEWAIILKYKKNTKHLIKFFEGLNVKKKYVLMKTDYLKLKKFLKNKNIFIYDGNINSFIKTIIESSLVISMRYHPLIICLKYFKPFVIISDENKLKNFAKTFNLKIFNLDKKNIDYLKINDYINTCKINYRKYWNMLNLKRFLNR